MSYFYEYGTRSMDRRKVKAGIMETDVGTHLSAQMAQWYPCRRP